MATSYRILLSDLLTGAITAEIPATQVALTRQLNSAGTATMNIIISDASSTAYNIVNSTQPGRTQIWIDRNGTLVFGGILWNRTYASATQHLSLTAQEFESYFAHRLITTTQVFNNVDVFTIIQTLVNQAQAVTGGNIGVVVPTSLAGVTATVTYYSYELRSVLTAIQDLTKANLLDFAITYAYDGGGTPVKTLALGSPRLGQAYSSSSLTAPVFEFPSGNIIEYEYPEDGTLAANTVYGSGAGSNEGKLIATSTDSTKLTAGWPLLETVVNYGNTSDATLLGNLAAGQLKAVSTPPVTMKIVLNPDTDPVLGSGFDIGWDARIRIQDDRFPNGIDTTYRIMALSLQAGEAGPERLTLSLTVPQV